MGRPMTPADNPILRTIALGGGIQSTTLVLMAAHGEIGPMPDAALFSDLGSESTATYEHIRWLSSPNVLPFPIRTIQPGNIITDILSCATDSNYSGFTRIPYFVDNGPDPAGHGTRDCTNRYKVNPLTQEHRRILGVPAFKNIRPNTVEVWLGISTDEASRMKPARSAWQVNRWPLIEKGMSRRDCMAWLKRHDYPVPPRSSCVFCPYHSDSEWDRIKRDEPEAWGKAVAIDHSLREQHKAANLSGSPYLHRSMRPLDQVDFTPGGDRQANLFSAECEGLCSG